MRENEKKIQLRWKRRRGLEYDEMRRWYFWMEEGKRRDGNVISEVWIIAIPRASFVPSILIDRDLEEFADGRWQRETRSS